MIEDPLKDSFHALHPRVLPSPSLQEKTGKMAAEADILSQARSRNRFMRWGIGITVTLTAMAATAMFLRFCYFIPWVIQANHRIARQNDPEATALLKKSADTMIHLKSYRAECWKTTTFQPKAISKPPPVRYTMAQIVEVKPNLMRYDLWNMTVSASGKPGTESLWKRIGDIPFDTYACNGKVAGHQSGLTYYIDNETSPDQITAPNGVLSQPWQGFFTTYDSPYHDVSSDTDNDLPVIAIQCMGKESVEGVLCDKVLVHYFVPGLHWYSLSGIHIDDAMDGIIYWYIGRDGLIRRKIETQQFKTVTISYDEIMRNIQVNVPVTSPESIFTYTPPKGITYKKEQ